MYVFHQESAYYSCRNPPNTSNSVNPSKVFPFLESPRSVNIDDSEGMKVDAVAPHSSCDINNNGIKTDVFPKLQMIQIIMLRG